MFLLLMRVFINKKEGRFIQIAGYIHQTARPTAKNAVSHFRRLRAATDDWRRKTGAAPNTGRQVRTKGNHCSFATARRQMAHIYKSAYAGRCNMWQIVSQSNQNWFKRWIIEKEIIIFFLLLWPKSIWKNWYTFDRNRWYTLLRNGWYTLAEIVTYFAKICKHGS